LLQLVAAHFTGMLLLLLLGPFYYWWQFLAPHFTGMLLLLHAYITIVWQAVIDGTFPIWPGLRTMFHSMGSVQMV